MDKLGKIRVFVTILAAAYYVREVLVSPLAYPYGSIWTRVWNRFKYFIGAEISDVLDYATGWGKLEYVLYVLFNFGLFALVIVCWAGGKRRASMPGQGGQYGYPYQAGAPAQPYGYGTPPQASPPPPPPGGFSPPPPPFQ